MAAEAAILHAPPTGWSRSWRRLRRDPTTLVCMAILAAIVLLALLAPWVSPGDPYRTSALRRLLVIGSPGYPLGTDELGRDMVTRLIYGGRLSLFMGLTPVLAATLIGGTLGIAAGFIGGWVNTAIMRGIDVMFAFPSVLLAVAISGVLGAGIVNCLIALTIVFIPPLTRIAESAAAGIANLEYVHAARASGARPWLIMRVHILPNAVGPILVYASSLVSISMILASGLSFLGLGTRPPEPEWGLMLNTLRPSLYVNPVVAALPGVMIFLTSFCFNMMSDGLRSAFDLSVRD